MKKKKWMIAADAPHDAEVLQRELALPHLAARVLAARGLGSPEQAKAFLDSSNRCIHDPFLLSDMETAVIEIERAIAAKEKIAVYGDYDVDGVTATCILIRYLRSRGVDCVYYIPDRLGEGYGLNTAAIGQLYEEGCRLLITVDSGITAIEEAEFAADLGLRLIITDHHECKEVLPRAYAIVNPRRLDSAYPFRELAGVGVAFKLICALEAQRPVEELLEEYGDIVAVGTIADVMPLVGENRCIVTQGLQLLAHTKNPGLRALVTTLGLDGKPVTSNTVSFVMAPRINAAGRMGGAALAARMFLTDSLEEATELAQKLCDLNRTRQEEENRIYIENCFGLPLYGRPESEQIELALCTDRHAGCHLYFTTGQRPSALPSDPLTRKAVRGAQEQEQRNHTHYRNRSHFYQNSIQRLSRQIQNALLVYPQPMKVPARMGLLSPSLIWRAVRLNDERIFTDIFQSDEPDFSVDLLLDASASRLQSQEIIAAQAYVIAQSLKSCQIPVQVSSFLSLRGHTIIRRFCGYSEADRQDRIFDYFAAGWNRDGLALRGCRHLMEDSPSKKRLLILLTDASPNDDRRIPPDLENGFFTGRDYSGDAGVEDTAAEVRLLKKNGVQVMAILNGEDGSPEAARKIYGEDFVRIENIRHLSDGVGMLLQKQIERMHVT